MARVIRFASLADLKAIDSLRRADQEAVGFIPASRYESEIQRSCGTILAMTENDDLVGYAYWTRGWPIARIQQLVVRPDARRRERATALVEAVADEAKRHYRYGISCRCRVDLEAIEFWKSIGWREIAIEQSGRRGPVIRFYKELTPALFDLGDYMPPTPVSRQISMRKGFKFLPEARLLLNSTQT